MRIIPSIICRHIRRRAFIYRSICITVVCIIWLTLLLTSQTLLSINWFYGLLLIILCLVFCNISIIIRNALRRISCYCISRQIGTFLALRIMFGSTHHITYNSTYCYSSYTKSNTFYQLPFYSFRTIFRSIFIRYTYIVLLILNIFRRHLFILEKLLYILIFFTESFFKVLEKTHLSSPAFFKGTKSRLIFLPKTSLA